MFRGKKKGAVPQAPPPAVRIALLPFNVPPENSELRWVSMTAPMVMAKTIQNSPAFDVVPFWQSYPVALESLGAGRSINPEVAAYVASRVGAKWATNGELSPAKNGVFMRIDFIPAKASLVPYRFEKELRLEDLAADSHEAFSQLIRYLVLQQLPKYEKSGEGAESMRPLAETLDREYGWFAQANPGKAEAQVASLTDTDNALARLLFNPGLYPGLAPAAALSKQPVELRTAEPQKPGPTPAPQVPPPTPAAAPQQIPAATPPPQAAPEPPPAAVQPAVTPAPVIPPATTETSPATLPVPIPRKAASTSGQSSARAGTLKSGIPPSAPPPAETAAPKVATPVTPDSKQPAAVPAQRTFQIQVYSTQQKEDAEQRAAGFTKAGYQARVEQVEIEGKGTWYRIRLIGFKSRDDAQAAGEKLVAEKQIRQYWIVP